MAAGYGCKSGMNMFRALIHRVPLSRSARVRPFAKCGRLGSSGLWNMLEETLFGKLYQHKLLKRIRKVLLNQKVVDLLTNCGLEFLLRASALKEFGMQFDRAKLKEVILYACSTCDPSRMGAVKLNKVLYFVDMLRYAKVGAPLTGAVYRKRPMGPTCDQLLSVLNELSRERALEIRNVDYFGYLKKEYIAVRQPDLASLQGCLVLNGGAAVGG